MQRSSTGGTKGHLFQGRPGLRLVEENAYFNNVVRYVVLNPVRAKMVQRPEEYEWSSHRAIIGAVDAPNWLAVDDVLMQFGPDRDTARAYYREFVNAGIGLQDDIWKDLVGQQYLGGHEWLSSVHRKIDLKPRVDDHPRQQRILHAPAMAQVVSVVADTLNMAHEDVRRRGTPRLLAAWLGSNEAFLTHREIAAGLRLQSQSHISRLLRESEAVIGTDPNLQRCIDRCISTIRGKQGKW